MLRLFNAKSIKKTITGTLVVLYVTIGIHGLAEIKPELDPILQFYLDRARHGIASHDPLSAGVKFVLHTNSHYKHIGRNGVVKKIDSAQIDFYYSWGELDSSVVVNGQVERFRRVDPIYPNLLDNDYQYNTFPNDTGGPELAIGFDNPQSTSKNPTGIMIIDRLKFTLGWLYLYFPEADGFNRLTRSYRFTEQSGLIFADSIWEVGARRGIFSSENYRLETAVTAIELLE